MKKITLLPILALLLVSCSKYDGTDYYSAPPQTISSPLKNYVLYISNDIVTASLEELESALKMDKENSTLSQYFYLSNGTPLSNDGSVWTVQRDSNLKGAKISKILGENAWEINFEGMFSFDGSKFETQFIIKATSPAIYTTDHHDWNVEITGKRTEEDNYHCTFYNVDSPISYKAVESDNTGWNAFGFLVMEVYKGTDTIDKLIMELRGGISSSSITRI